MERNLQTIFEISEQSLSLEWLILLIFIIGGVLAYRNSPRKSFGRYFSIFYLSITVGFLLFLGIGNTYSFFRLKAIYKNKEYMIAEGYVRDFVPAKPKSGETYTVNNISFRGGKGNQGYSGDWQTDGRINEGVYVRLFYIETKRETIILRVDIDR
jgi:hypothetical protein